MEVMSSSVSSMRTVSGRILRLVGLVLAVSVVSAVLAVGATMPAGAAAGGRVTLQAPVRVVDTRGGPTPKVIADDSCLTMSTPTHVIVDRIDLDRALG